MCIPIGDDQIRQHYVAAWACELAGTFGKPVVLEEFGVSSDFATDDNAAHYYRHVLHNSLLAGATGWIAWNNTDFDLSGQDPYRHHAFELRLRPHRRQRRAQGDAEGDGGRSPPRCERSTSAAASGRTPTPP